jgi:hypothetical protein
MAIGERVSLVGIVPHPIQSIRIPCLVLPQRQFTIFVGSRFRLDYRSQSLNRKNISKKSADF